MQDLGSYKNVSRDPFRVWRCGFVYFLSRDVVVRCRWGTNSAKRMRIAHESGVKKDRHALVCPVLHPHLCSILWFEGLWVRKCGRAWFRLYNSWGGFWWRRGCYLPCCLQDKGLAGIRKNEIRGRQKTEIDVNDMLLCLCLIKRIEHVYTKFSNVPWMYKDRPSTQGLMRFLYKIDDWKCEMSRKM